ncbi:MAG TPA: hypothetical protein H9746_04380 [Candidatus Butyricicoccus avistercoris]|uniref:Cell division protein FtsL n=1 Tax=Candidatus Butyricicoccus avistercoris TaxID=2838518 RepID=A0A9D1PHE0_9FIRM|nr:hypothetical protein [Candidatus Butyricicoccus avistercoris]
MDKSRTANQQAPKPTVRQTTKSAARKRTSRSKLLRMLSFPRVMAALALACFCAMLLYSNMNLTRLTKEIGEQETALEQVQSEYVSLKARKEQTLSISYVENYAQNELGMVKMDPSQIEYIEMTKPEVTEVSDTTKLGDAAANLMRGFTAVLEYLR